MTTMSDQSARDRIRTETGTNLFVEAGAGSGKTRSLVDRVTQLVLVDGVPLRQIAAVTFTEKAGAELRDRLRANLEKQRRETERGSEAHARASEALEDLDSAAIGTLHSFAQRILTMHPIEAGLPPLVEVLDEVASSVAFEERWSVLQRELLEDDDLAERLLLALAAGVKLDHLRSLTRAFGADWDLIGERVLTRPPIAASLPEVVELADEAVRLAARAAQCTQAEDKFLPHLEALGAWGQSLAKAVDDRARYAALVAAENLKLSFGRKGSWPDLAGLKSGCQDLKDRAKAAADAFTEATLRPLAYWIAGKVHDAAQTRAAEGRLEFHDLLVLAREMLRQDPDVRASLQRHFRRLLLDEFQDTDPIQIELAVRIAGGRDADAANWSDVVVPPGSLFVVGDPKQSIYRFRRASIALYLQTREWFGQDQQVQLTTNFRTVDPLLTWVNRVFSQVIAPAPLAQPDYTPLESHRTETGAGPAVTVLGAEARAEKTSADELRILEADDVAAAISTALTEGWTVFEEATNTWRPIQHADIAILIPSRISLGALETALDAATIPYRAESSSLLYQAQEVRDLLMAARAVADASDQFSCVMALRSSLFGCGDDDLWTWKRARGSFNLCASTEETQARLGIDRPHPVGASLDYLRRLHFRARWMTPSEVLAALVADRMMLEVAVGGTRPRDQWRRLRFVVDQARAWSEVEHGGLRAYLQWATKQGEESSRVAEAVLPETDVDAVRIMTIHGAKGLEFPMVVLSGMSSQPRNPSGVQLLWTEDEQGTQSYAVKLTKAVQTNDFKDAAPIDEQMDGYERRRLLYVAATRARDHLVVSLHRGPGSVQSNARLLAEAGGTGAPALQPFSADGSSRPAGRTAAVAPPPDWDVWLERIARVRERARLVPARSASGLEGTDPEVTLADNVVGVAGLHKGGRDVELPPWKKGRYGSAVGRAVHGVLQVVDLGSGAGLDDAVSAQCLSEGVTEHADHVAGLVRNALASDVVRRAAARPHWRESYVGTVQEDGTVLEGFVDLLYREDDGSLVVVDYKTDDIPAEAISARTAFYQPQLRAYVDMVADATGGPVGAKLLFLTS